MYRYQFTVELTSGLVGGEARLTINDESITEDTRHEFDYRETKGRITVLRRQLATVLDSLGWVQTRCPRFGQDEPVQLYGAPKEGAEHTVRGVAFEMIDAVRCVLPEEEITAIDTSALDRSALVG
jgi:hypothetical protein